MHFCPSKFCREYQVMTYHVSVENKCDMIKIWTLCSFYKIQFSQFFGAANAVKCHFCLASKLMMGKSHVPSQILFYKTYRQTFAQ